MTVKINIVNQVQSSVPYSERLNAILHSAPSAETIDTYGSDSLQSYANLVDKYTDAYSTVTPGGLQTGLQIETDATSYWNLPPVESILDELSERDKRIQALSVAIARAVLNYEVITPPDSTKGPVTQTGNGNFAPKELLGKAKVTLYILENDFGVDTADPLEVQIDTGIVAKNMMRRESFLGICVPKIDKLIMVCDESENATYVFNISKLGAIGLTPNMILLMHKSEYRELLKQHSSLGLRILYSENFTDEMRNAIAGSIDPNSSAVAPAPSLMLTVSGMQGKFGVTKKTLNKIINEHQASIGTAAQFNLGSTSRSLMGYDPKQQSVIEGILSSKGYLVEAAPSGVLSETGMIEIYGLTYRSISLATKELGDRLGVVNKYRFDANRVQGFTPEQQDAIINAIRENGYQSELAPEEFRSVTGISEEWGIARPIIQVAITELGDIVGEPFTGRSSSNIGKKSSFYSPAQQEVIQSYLKANGHFVGVAPEGVLNVKGMALEWHINDDDIKRYIGQLGETLGPIDTFKFGKSKKKALGYTQAQQAQIRNHIKTLRELSK